MCLAQGLATVTPTSMELYQYALFLAFIAALQLYDILYKESNVQTFTEVKSLVNKVYIIEASFRSKLI